MNAYHHTLLVVDDDDDIREILYSLLEFEGYQVVQLDNGSQVYQVVRQQRPALILLDVMLGDSDGREICQALKKDPVTRDIPVIILSASHTIETPGGQSCGAESYISKPFDIELLLGTVARLLP